jgi:8-oxo-dGTP pyrophosphatase MutT (NUDIX family)
MTAEPVVRAAGGLVWRGSDGAVELLLVHRPKYDDWTFPKGKCDPGESDEDAAIREVAEETGLRCRLDHELASSHYDDARGRPKLVRYWVMVAEEGSFEPNDEVDAVRWVPLAEVGDVLTYGRDRPVLESFEAWLR